jgi:hypothetical protein
MVITAKTRQGQISELKEILAHPMIQKKCVLAAILNVTAQRINSWLVKGLGQVSLDLINNNQELINVKQSKKIGPKKWSEIKLKRIDKARKFAKLMDIHDIAETTKLTYHALSMCRLRGAISLPMAKSIAKMTAHKIEDIRPDIPELAIKYNVQRW